MRLINATNMQADYTLGVDRDGREWLVVVVKGTFQMPERAADWPALAAEQAPLVQTDAFTGEPGFSAPLYEIDYAPRKPRCDVLLNGSAHAPEGKPVERLTVGLRVGSVQKSFDVVGNRSWKHGMMFLTPSVPEPFSMMPISYNNAFGGVDRPQEGPAGERWHPLNPVGIGYHENTRMEALAGKPLPNTEETGRRISDTRGKYLPMAFGPVGRSWKNRIRWAGTYDQKWLEHKFPFLPDDFDERYYQSAPEDQQTDHLTGGEPVVLTNLTPQGRTEFRLPAVDVPVLFVLKKRERELLQTVTDTLILEPDQKRFMLTCRVALALRRNIHEVHEVHVGRRFIEGEVIPGKPGRRRFSSLAALAASNRGTDREEG